MRAHQCQHSREKAVENFDLTKRAIKYSTLIKGKKINEIKGDEEITRACILTKLTNEYGYALEDIELEHEYTAGRPHTNTSIIDVIVRDKKGDAFLFMELKSPDAYTSEDKDKIIEEQLFKVAAMEQAEGHFVKYLVLYTISVLGNEIKDDCIIIDHEKYITYKDWEVERDYANEIPVKYGKAQKIPYIKGSAKDLETHFTNEMLTSLQNDLHNVLWGGGGTGDNDVFSSLTNLILAKIQDEVEKDNGQKYDFQCFAFKDEETDEYESLDDLYERINGLYRRALENKLNITDKKRLATSQVVDTNKFSLAKVKYTVQSLEKYSFVDGKNSLSGKDILGDFFEGIIRDGFKQSKGQFFTHINIVKFMLWAIQADRLAIKNINAQGEIPYMIDPSAGSGTFLIEYMKFITANIKYRFRDQLSTNRNVKDRVESDWFYPDDRENKWAKEFIYGCELNFDLGTATKVNLILHGDGSTNIFVGAQKGDGLLPFPEYTKETGTDELNKQFDDKNYPKKINGRFDLILTNPPFSVDLDNETKKKLEKSFLFGNKKNSENLFIERYYQLLKEGGRLAAVLPESVYDTTENKYIILDKIFALKKSVESKRSIIDAVFKEYFGYDYDKFESLKTMTYYSSYSQYGNNIDTRFSAKFHRPAGEFVYQELNSRPNKKIKKLLILPMITGQGIATTDYDENGDYAYVSMADISSWSLNLNDIKYVSNDYAKKKLTKKIKGNKTPISTEIGLNDILLMRSGEGGIGKVAIVEDDAKGIFCDFIIRMRFDENQMNPLFAYYYFCTRYFQYLVEINKKGLGNNTNIFPNQIQEFPIPYISLNEQKLIVDSINAELEKQKVIDKKIMKEREKIEKILAAVIA